ncbi:uncharacterized protein BX663DRAFT_530594 [Cokeromyces recurvatus]|uniref:uncharacterized protein n=1 Tax=Cokeromyces recurvatus TaxID=90255 RepID=UPI0022208756|nr:uncharacterized protein BX663DRAFT_530594 [Cokeromyces recurvatus]KAI7903950.1 hypothetical protein BX663DRAFT_530594 [Cokeromyces recurvatus]
MIIDPILWLPMTNTERSQVLRWRLGWIPGGISRPCPYHPSQTFSRTHSIECLHMHHRLQMPRTVTDPLCFLLNQLLTKKLKCSQDMAHWTIRWPVICIILHEMNYLFHERLPPDPPSEPGLLLVKWLFN